MSGLRRFTAILALFILIVGAKSAYAVKRDVIMFTQTYDTANFSDTSTYLRLVGLTPNFGTFIDTDFATPSFSTSVLNIPLRVVADQSGALAPASFTETLPARVQIPTDNDSFFLSIDRTIIHGQQNDDTVSAIWSIIYWADTGDPIRHGGGDDVFVPSVENTDSGGYLFQFQNAAVPANEGRVELIKITMGNTKVSLLDTTISAVQTSGLDTKDIKLRIEISKRGQHRVTLRASSTDSVIIDAYSTTDDNQYLSDSTTWFTAGGNDTGTRYSATNLWILQAGDFAVVYTDTWQYGFVSDSPVVAPLAAGVIRKKTSMPMMGVVGGYY